MSELEFFSTIGAFIAGLMLLVYLFRIRSKVIKAIQLRLLQAKAKAHKLPPKNDIWKYAAYKKRDLR